MAIRTVGRMPPHRSLVVVGLLVLLCTVTTTMYFILEITDYLPMSPVADAPGPTSTRVQKDSDGPLQTTSSSYTQRIAQTHSTQAAHATPELDATEESDQFPEVWDVDGWPIEATPEKALRRNRRFVIIVPATSPNVNLCKTVLSALALGYPAPIVVGWGMNHKKITKWDGGPNLIKIPAILEYLDTALRADAHKSEKLEHDDIVLIADAYDVWFQLPPQVLLQRYHEINHQANARLREQWRGPGAMPMWQTIIAGSEKNCWPRPKYGTDIQCPSLPDSPVRSDLYGPETDKNQTDRHNLRPRYINGGIYMGPAGDMQRWLRRAAGIMATGIAESKKLRSEQGITGQVFGEQEVWRQWRRANARTAREQLFAPLIERDFEYHIGLDYFQAITVQTQNGDDDGRFVQLNNRKKIKKHSDALGILPTRLRHLPADIKAAENPLTDIIDNAPAWEDMSLYADFYTEAVPVILHHNGKGPGQRERREGWWDQPWFFPHLRKLVRRHLESSLLNHTVIATVETLDQGNFTYRYLDAEKKSRMPRLVTESTAKLPKKTTFDEICASPGEAWWEEVFRDGMKL